MYMKPANQISNVGIDVQNNTLNTRVNVAASGTLYVSPIVSIVNTTMSKIPVNQLHAKYNLFMSLFVLVASERIELPTVALYH